MSNELKALEGTVVTTSDAVSAWKTNQAKIETAIADANDRLAKAEGRRKALALDANLGNATAIAEIAKARTESARAEQDLSDLQHALSDAGKKLNETEAAAAQARHSLALHQAKILMRERISVAAKLDSIIAEFTAALGEYDRLAHEIKSVPNLLARNLHGSMANGEQIDGDRRVRSALPRVMLRFYRGALHEESPAMSLEASEIQTWSLAPILETPTSKAA
jgi:predicted  nucleic acid-binding Zn-ribbon protein